MPPFRTRSALRALAAIAATVAVGCDAGASAGYGGPGFGAEGCPGIAGERVRWIVPFSPGGGFDVHARLLAPFLGDATGARVAVENRVGAGGRVGARAIRDARPDGRTIGIVNATSLLVSDLSEEIEGLHPLENFQILARVGFAEPIWAVGAGSELRTLDDILALGDGEPLVFGITDVGSTGFVSVSAVADLLGIDVEYIAGYPGNREASLGLMRGEFDLGGFTFESVLDRIEAGDMIPVLQISDEPFPDHPSLVGVPVLAGPEGLVARLAIERGEDPAPAMARAEALVRMFQAGRLVVGPPGMAPEVAQCLSDRLSEVMRDSAFIASSVVARRAFAYLSPSAVLANLESTEADRAALAPVLRAHIERARGGTSR